GRRLRAPGARPRQPRRRDRLGGDDAVARDPGKRLRALRHPPRARAGGRVRQRLLRALARHVKLISWLAVLGWLAWIAGAITSGRPFRPGWLVTLFVIFVATALYGAWVASRQRMEIREGRLPFVLKRKLRQQFPKLEAKDADLVERGFRQFFMTCSRSDGRDVAMPSKIVDAYWHAFILDTKG